MKRLLVVLVCGIAFGSNAAASPVSGSELTDIFANGKPFMTETAKGEKYQMTLNPDGTGQIVKVGTNNAVEGTWRVDGDQYCAAWGGGAENCFTADVENGIATMTSKGKPAGTWTR
jgi:hypothetical protein